MPSRRPTTPARPAPPRPTRAELAAAVDRTVRDVIAPELRVLFCGINPGLYTGATGFHFAGPGNRFWPALHRSGFTPRQYAPHEVRDLLALGLGVTNVVQRTTATAAELSPAEFIAGARRLRSRLRRYRPRVLAVLGVGAYRTGFARPLAAVGPQEETIGDTRVWVLPNPSGLNASYPLPRIVELFAALRAAVDR